MTKINRTIEIAIVGLGQVGIYLYNELNIKKNEIEKNWKKIRIVAISAKNKNKKRRFNISKDFYTDPFKILKIEELIFYLNALDCLMVSQKK